MLQTLLNVFDLNPILFWEVVLRQSYDKVCHIDDQTAFYNIEIQEDSHLMKRCLVKIIHIFSRNVLFVFTTPHGKPVMSHLFKENFKFTKNKQQKQQVLDIPQILITVEDHNGETE
jgi:hypothetical protein